MAPGSRSLDPYHIEPSGIGGAVFFSPIFILWLKLDPTVAVGVALVTEFFGFSSGLIAYVRAKLIDYRLGGQLLVFIGLQLFQSWRQEQKEAMDAIIEAGGDLSFASELVD